MHRKLLFSLPKRNRLHVHLSPVACRSRLLTLLVMGTLFTGCQDAEPPLAPTLDGPAFSNSPSHALKGTIAFHSNRNGGSFFDVAIFVMNADGTGVTQLTNTAGAIPDLFPSWSPNGKRLAFLRLDGGPKVMVMNADGTDVTQLTDGSPGAWSPNGKQIVFQKFVAPFEMFVINADGSGETPLGVSGTPRGWSRNGKQILFQSFSNIFVMNADGSDPTQVTFDGSIGEGAGWSPNGKKIVFTRLRNGNADIYVINADGMGETRLTSDAAEDKLPTWSPNGKQIAFTSTRDGDEEIFVMNADGSGVIQLTFNTGADDAVPAWTKHKSIDAKVTATFPNSDCQYEQKSNKIKLLNDCETWNLNGIELAPGTKFDGKKHTVTSRAEFKAIRGTGGSFEIKHVNIVCEQEDGVALQGASPDRSKIKVEHVHTFGCRTGIEIEHATDGSKISHNHATGRNGVSVLDSDNVKVDHNEVAGEGNRVGDLHIRLSNVQNSKVSHNRITGAGTPCFDSEALGVNKWDHNKNLTGNPSLPPELCPLSKKGGSDLPLQGTFQTNALNWAVDAGVEQSCGGSVGLAGAEVASTGTIASLGATTLLGSAAWNWSQPAAGTYTPTGSPTASGTVLSSYPYQFSVDGSLTAPACVPPGVGVTATGEVNLTAANGDQVFGHVTGGEIYDLGSTLKLFTAATITGGTGRFAKATGSFVTYSIFNVAAITIVSSEIMPGGTISY